ncbi:hypothetical protein M0802_013583 [Mischocyttarus mexicanus]|nr:hypothetical protein M0802_013583 [Mischocyttarus mexicanus]
MADTASSESTSREVPNKGWLVLKQFAIDNKIKTGLWLTRLLTMIFTISYIIPIFGNVYNIYYKALMSNAATSALRLHQRLPNVQFNREFLGMLLLEDSCHYLFYSIIFLYVPPVTIVLVPIFLFAMLHVCSFSLELLDCLGHNSWWPVRLAISLVEVQSYQVLRFCAISEIIILPFTVLLVFTGRVGILTPIIYYQFLKMRLASQRNSFTRNLFYEIRNLLSTVAKKPAMPDILRQMIQGFLSLTQQMVPVRQ